MAPLTTCEFLQEQRGPVPPVVKADLTGKTIVIVGANAGLGFEASKHFASMNPGRLILACRNKQKGEAALSDIQSATGFSRMEVWVIDLSDFASVKTFADRFDKEDGRLDILIENAGIIPTDKSEITKDGWLTIFQTNCISPALLAYRLLPHMLKTAEEHSITPRLVVTSSEVHYWASLHKHKAVVDSKTPLKAMSSEVYIKKAGSPLDVYQDSKLLNVLFVRDLQKRLIQPTITVDTVNPGFCVSQLRSEWSGIQAMMGRLVEKAMAHTSEEGSRQLVYGAVGGTETQMKGSYISSSKVAEPSDFVISAEGVELQSKIFAELLELLPLVGSSKEILKQYLTMY